MKDRKAIKVLNLYAGIGGNRKLWKNVEVTAVEIEPKIAQIYQDLFPQDKVIIGDAHEYLLKHFEDFDFIWSSPPCPTHSRMQPLMVCSNSKWNASRKAKYPDMKLYEEIILLKEWFKGKFCIENVISYYKPLIKPRELHRHYFWSNFHIFKMDFIRVNIAHATVEELEQYHGFDLSKYNLTKAERELFARNCVYPPLAKHILDCAFKIKQEVLK